MKEENLTENITATAVAIVEHTFYSEYLERDIVIDTYLPAGATNHGTPSLLLINDGQDLVTMNFGDLLSTSINAGSVEPIIYVGIHAGTNRLNEYGIAYRTDYLGRGSKAGLYSKFILDELLPFLKSYFNISSFKDKSFAGFSLGALSAIDIVWNNPNEFTRIGVFSGALWWRKHGYDDPAYNWEKDRIMHLQVQKGEVRPGLQFFFQAGKLDETADRNNNGIIDSIEDTTDLIAILKDLGYNENQLVYLELEDGRHDIPTWKRAFPAFLQWGWGSSDKNNFNN